MITRFLIKSEKKSIQFFLAHRDVPQLVKMIGPEPSKFAGMSPRIDEFVQSITAKLARVPSF